jgi:hypothetical protein
VVAAFGVPGRAQLRHEVVQQPVHVLEATCAPAVHRAHAPLVARTRLCRTYTLTLNRFFLGRQIYIEYGSMATSGLPCHEMATQNEEVILK